MGIRERGWVRIFEVERCLVLGHGWVLLSERKED